MSLARALAAVSITLLAAAVDGRENNPMSQSELVQYLADERTYYLNGFRASYDAWCREKAGVCAAEVLMRPNGLTWPEPYVQVRLDMVSNLNGKFEASRYEHDQAARQVDALTLEIGGLKVILSSVVWNRIEFRSTNAPKDVVKLSSWVERWLDVRDAKSPGPDHLAGVIHSVTYPTKSAGVWEFTVDFGSAPVAAFEELLGALAGMGLREVTVGTFTPIR